MMILLFGIFRSQEDFLVRWRLLEPDSEVVSGLAREAGVDPLCARVLANRGVVPGGAVDFLARVQAEHGLDTMPLYLREGAVVPMGPVVQWVGSGPPTPSRWWWRRSRPTGGPSSRCRWTAGR